MGRIFKQFRLLLWKNFLIQKRRPISTVFEILLPVFLIIVLLIIRIVQIKYNFQQKIEWLPFNIGTSLPDQVNNRSMTESTQWTIAYTPNDSQFFKIMHDSFPKFLKDVEVAGYDTDSDMLSDLRVDMNTDISQQKFLCGIVFLSSPGSKDITYQLRFPPDARSSYIKKREERLGSDAPKQWFTQSVFPRTFQGIGARQNSSRYGGTPLYFEEGFTTVQRALEFAIIDNMAGSTSASTLPKIEELKIEMQRFPYPSVVIDEFIGVIQNSLSLVLMLSLVYTALCIVKNIVIEKEKRLKESMKMMGLSNWLHWAAWYTKCFVFLLIPMIFVTIFTSVSFGDNGSMLQKSDGSVVFVFLILFSMASINFCFLVSTLFSRANVAAAAAGILWFMAYVPYFFLANYYYDMSKTSKLAACLDFQVAMSYGAFLIGQFEGQASGVQWSNIASGVSVDDSFAFGEVMLMLVVDCLVYSILTWYIESVFPGEFGIPKKFYFPFQVSYWRDTKQADDKTMLVDAENSGFVCDDSDEMMKDNFEAYPDNMSAGIKIRHLKKQFNTPKGLKVAVDNVSLNLYEGQITALLGHNGAGKTTTISMLTGLFPPTSGNAVVNGYDISRNMTGVRESLGICPQHNVLFDTLTVEEHLWFFTTLKGVGDRQHIQQEVDHMIKALALEDKRHTQSQNLSGGMKRKLSVGNALVGNSKIVILDEPTSGMDVAARRFTWDLLQRERRGRTILLTTHYMDEADVLGDKIAIMAAGKVKCYGSSLFLKKRYGVGYHMVMVKAPTCDVPQVTQLLTSYVPTSQLESNIGFELSYILPSDYSHKFEELFSELEKKREELGILSYGASVTTLEEVFIKVGEEQDTETNTTHKSLFRQLSQKQNIPESSTEPAIRRGEFTISQRDSQDISYTKNTGFNLFRQKWWAMFIKRFTHSKRHKWSLISQLLMPSLFVLMALAVAKSTPKLSEPSPRTMTLDMFEENHVVLADSKSSIFSPIEEQFKRTLQRYTSDPKVLSSNKSDAIPNYLLSKSTNRLGSFNKHYLIALQFRSGANQSDIYTTAWFNNEAYHTPAVSVNFLSNVLLSTYTSSNDTSITAINYPLPPNNEQTTRANLINTIGFQVAFNLCFGMAFLASSFIVFLVQERSSKAKHLQFVSGVDPLSYWTSAYVWDLINFLLPCIVIFILFVAFQEESFSGDRLGYVALLMLLYGWAIIPLMYIFSFFFVIAPTAYTRMTILNVITGLAALLVVFILTIPSLDALDIRDVFKWVFLFMPSYNLGQGMVDLSTNYLFISAFSTRSIAAQCTQLAVSQFPQGVKIDRNHIEFLCNLTLDSYNGRGKINIDICSKDISDWIFSFLGVHINSRRVCELVQRALDQSTKFFQWDYLAWETPGIARYCIFLAIEGFLFFGVVLIIEYKVIQHLFGICCLRSKLNMDVIVPTQKITNDLDSDVVAEQRRVASQSAIGGDVLSVKEITKVFRVQGNPLVAVDHLSLGVPHGECFGLLGQNGAGKTTTFRILTGDETMSSGSAFIDSYDVSRDLSKVRQRMGYCPQFDALIDLMTGRELLWMFCRLRGVPEQCIGEVVEKLAKDLSVFEHIDKYCNTYSGGNKRKLSTAIALCGDPLLIFLDEPSSGMDPVAQRMMWNSLSSVIASGKSIVLTSHSMEECEALCTRVAIMVNGQFKCLGSPQHLKNKFGEGYTLIAKIGEGISDAGSLKEFVESTFPGSVLKDEHQGYIHYQLKASDKTWANLFGIMENAKQEYHIEDYSISQTTLEQVFLNFTRVQREADD